MIIKDALDYIQPTKYLVKSTDYNNKYPIPVLTAGKTFILGYSNETEGIYPSSKSPVLLFDDFTGDIKYVDFDFKIKSSAAKIIIPKNSSQNIKYYFYLLKHRKIISTEHQRLWISKVSNLSIQEVNSSVQASIVSVLDNINESINLKNKQLAHLDELIKSRFIRKEVFKYA